ncbi:hypothetical protein ACN9JZ_05210 [Aliarcobacter butzleri]|uniref:hypothetical protein n=1 Tax=Aliarcobacter butzleri TaxID=28197 RepID=UPI003AF68654
MHKFTQDRIKYTNSFVAFLDVLGFKNLVFSSKAESKEKLNIYFNVVERAIEYLKGIREKIEIGYIVISDSIILTIPQSENNDEKIENLRQLCIAVGFLQVTLSVEDIWLRGAISSGETYFDKTNNQIIGPAYINAYLLEENLAKYPRVILDNKIIKELKFTNSQDFIDEINQKSSNYLNFENCGKYILFDWNIKDNNNLEKDIPLFIDYLSFFLKNDENHNKHEIMEQVIINIENNIYNNTSLYEKFKWLSIYFSELIKNQKSEMTDYIKRLKDL